VIGSVHEWRGTKTKEFPLLEPGSTFTDDTVLTVAVADALMHDRPYAEVFWEYYRRYPRRGYGPSFRKWLSSKRRKAYNSYGNGSAMRVSPVAWFHERLEDVLAEAERSAAVTHNHPEGVKGAQATAAAIFLARTGEDKEAIRRFIEWHFYPPSQYPAIRQKLDDLRPGYRFDVTCQGTVPAALVVFWESRDYEDAVRNAISLGGDADTLACIAGSIAEAYYGGVPDWIAQAVLERLDNGLRQTVELFRGRYVLPKPERSRKI
jgi:ADP-ribosylglycohydrolase